MVQTKADREKQKLITDKCQALIEVLLKDEDNKYCVDCDAKGPRWASWNLGIFLCIRCAGIHRNLGVHISRVKSVNLDAWTPEHVAYVQRMGNSRARAVYEANLPDDFRRPQTDTALESFIRAKYEHKRYIDADYVDPGPPKPAFNAEEELKRAKEQKRSKLSSGSNKTMISVSDSFVPAAPVKQQATSSSTKSRVSSSQQPQTLLFGNDNITPAAATTTTTTTNVSVTNTSTTTNNSSSKQKSNLADLMDLDLGGFGTSNMMSPNANMMNSASTMMTNSMMPTTITTPTFSPATTFNAIPDPFSSNVGFGSSTTPTTTTTNNNNNDSSSIFNLDAAPIGNTNQSITGNTGKNVFDLLDI